jgi:hypothetical protein
MTGEDAKKEGGPEFHEQSRHFEEQLLGAKDGILRLWERNRHMQERLGQVEKRLQWFTWLFVALLVSGVGALAFLSVGYIVPLRDSIGELQTQTIALQHSLHTLEQRRDQTTQAAAAPTGLTKAEVVATIQELAPEMLTLAFKNAVHVNATGHVGVGTTTPEAPLHVVGNLLGAATGSINEALRIVVGQLDPKTTRWRQYTEGGISVDIDTSSAGFTSTPLYFTSLGGHTNNWLAQGVTSIYQPTAQGFRVHISYPELTVAKAKEWGWYVSWVAVGK